MLLARSEAVGGVGTGLKCERDCSFLRALQISLY